MLPKSVLVTRPIDQSKQLNELLENNGFKAISLPLIKLERIKTNPALDSFFNELDSFDWIVFTSVNAVKFFFEAAEEKGVKFYFYPDLKIATVGEKTKLQLEQLGYRTNFVPIKYTAEVLADNMDDVAGKKILIPRSSDASNHYIEVFKSRKAEAIPLTIYQNSPVTYSLEEFSEKFNQNIDYLTFASGSAVKAFDTLLKMKGATLTKEKLICIGPSTAKVANELGYEVTAIAEPHTNEGIIEAILKEEKNVKTAQT